MIHFDMLERERPIGFNLLEYRDVEERDLIIDELYLTLDRIWDMRQSEAPSGKATSGHAEMSDGGREPS